MATSLEELKALGQWYGLFYVPYSDVVALIDHMKEEHRKELSDMSQIAYSEGLQDGANQ